MLIFCSACSLLSLLACVISLLLLNEVSHVSPQKGQHTRATSAKTIPLNSHVPNSAPQGSPPQHQEQSSPNPSSAVQQKSVLLTLLLSHQAALPKSFHATLIGVFIAFLPPQHLRGLYFCSSSNDGKFLGKQNCNTSG